jgi:hypothetical protein
MAYLTPAAALTCGKKSEISLALRLLKKLNPRINSQIYILGSNFSPLIAAVLGTFDVFLPEN